MKKASFNVEPCLFKVVFCNSLPLFYFTNAVVILAIRTSMVGYGSHRNRGSLYIMPMPASC